MKSVVSQKLSMARNVAANESGWITDRIERERGVAARAFEVRDDVQRAGDVERARRELEVLVLTRHEAGFGHVS